MSSTPAPRSMRQLPPADFSTRFLASDGIPTYNALLDTHLGKRREFLLGNKRSLAHLQRTGAIAHVETTPENPQQYVVYMNEPKPSTGPSLRRGPSLNYLGRGRPPMATGVTRSESTPQLTSDRIRTQRRTIADGEENEAEADDPKSLSRSVSMTDKTKTKSSPSPSAVINRLRRRRSSQVDIAPSKQEKRTPVERLLENDAAYQLKIQILQEEMRVLEHEKQYFDQQIAKMRKNLKGINAVHENDVAVAHCGAIMHARIVKAEEEYMKLVTTQQQVKTDIDTLRRELLAMRKVKKKLVDDIADVEATNASVTDKIRAAKSIRNGLQQELVELERRAEIEADEQRLKLPPEETVVVDAQELMSAVQQRKPESGEQEREGMRRATIVLKTGSPLENLQRLLSERAIVQEVVVDEKPLLPFRRAFCVIQQTLGLSDPDQDEYTALDRFVNHFDETEDALLSKHKLNTQLQDELDQLEKDATKLAHEAAQRHASIRGTQHIATAMQHELQDKIHHTLERIDTYNELRDVRNHEQTRLRAIMQRCLEILHAEKLVNSQESLAGPLLLSELSTPAMLEALQKKMTEVAITLKLQHHAKGVDNDADGNDQTETSDRHTSVLNNRVQRPNSATRRTNLLLKRDNGASNIVLGPREPSGAALKAILITAQPPTVDGAQVLSETHAAGMHALHPTIVAVTSAPTRAPRKLTLTRMSVRASRHATFMTSGSMRRISTSSTNSQAEETTISTRSTRGSFGSSSKRLLPTQSSSSDSLQLQTDDANAHVIENTDELDA